MIWLLFFFFLKLCDFYEQKRKVLVSWEKKILQPKAKKKKELKLLMHFLSDIRIMF